MVDNFLKSFAESKIPTLLLIGIIMFVGAHIITGSEGSQTIILIGLGIELVGLVLAIISFAEYRYKEHVDMIINHYSRALSNISKTHSAFENKALTDLKSGKDVVGSDDEVYTLEKETGTGTS